MEVTGLLLASAYARRARKPVHYFNHRILGWMHERGNTHYCFHCFSTFGFTPARRRGPGLLRFMTFADITTPTNHEEGTFDGMKDHDATHADGVVGGASRYRNAHTWLARRLPKRFPFVVAIV